MTLGVNERTKKMYWDARLTNGDKVFLEVHSMLFDPNNFNDFRANYERCHVRMLKEIVKRNDSRAVLHQLIHDHQ